MSSFYGFGQRRSVPLSQQIGTTGLRRTGGFVVEETIPQLRNLRQAVRLYSEMVSNVSVLGAANLVIDSLVRQVSWEVKTPPGKSDDDQALFWRDRVEEMLHDMEERWEDVISEALSVTTFGFSVFSVAWKVRRGEKSDPLISSSYDDGIIAPASVEIRAQETVHQWEFDDRGRAVGFIQVDPYAPDQPFPYIPLDRCLHFVTRSHKKNPQGYSFLRPGVREYHIVKRLQESEAIGVSKDLTGVPVLEVPREILSITATPDDVALRGKLEDMIQRLQTDERMGILLPASRTRDDKPSGYTFRLEKGGGARMINTDPIIRRYETRLLQLYLCEFINVGQEKVGTQSLYEGKTNLFGVALRTLLDGSIGSVLRRDLVEKAMRANKVPRDLWPVLQPSEVFSRDLQKIGAFLTSLGQSSLLSPNPDLERELLRDAGLPEPPESNLRTDPGEVTPADLIDQSTGLMSERQLDAVLRVNQAIASGQITVDVARATLSRVLGVGPDHVDQFLSRPEGDRAVEETTLQPDRS